MKKLLGFTFIMAVLIAQPAKLAADSLTISIDVTKPGFAISPMLYGIFFEDINRSGDGGLYDEMIQNRSFEDFPQAMGWALEKSDSDQAKMTLDSSQPLNQFNPTSLRLDITGIGTGGRVAIVNQGYKGILIRSKDPVTTLPPDWLKHFYQAQKLPENGMCVRAAAVYDGSIYVRVAKPFTGPIEIALETQNGTVLADQEITNLSPSWKKYTFNLKPNATDKNARFVISTKSQGTIWLDMVSLFPADTFNHRTNGLRPDLMEMLVALHPAFVRFPAGSFGQGHRLDEAFRWKETIGDIAERPGEWNIWGYRSTNGLGYFEYLQMCEDLKAEPLFVINCGIAQANMVDVKDLGLWIQDAIDCVEYANGPPSSHWGALRAAAGHPAPFNLKYLEIGNENGMGYRWGGGNAQEYADRYKPFYEKVKAVYPSLNTIATAPIQMPPNNAPVETVDEHYYESATWFEDHASMYDGYDRHGPKIYVGEYATKEGAGNGNLNAALGEAAFLTGIERNSDLVQMASYAPLFVNPEWRAWNPNLIVFDSIRVYGTPSYYNQLLFASNRPDVLVPIDLQLPTPSDLKARKPIYAVAGQKKTGEIIVKVVNISSQPEDSKIELNGASTSMKCVATVLTSASPNDENSFEEPKRITPEVKDLGTVKLPLAHTFPPYSITVLRFQPVH